MRNTVDLNLLLSLDALLTERSVTRAAALMSVGQPAMSASLARLRKHFADPLLVRTPQGMMPSPRALKLHTGVRQALLLQGALHIATLRGLMLRLEDGGGSGAPGGRRADWRLTAHCGPHLLAGMECWTGPTLSAPRSDRFTAK